MKFNFIYVILLSALMTACASQQLNAPCDNYANFCGSKTKINQW